MHAISASSITLDVYAVRPRERASGVDDMVWIGFLDLLDADDAAGWVFAHETGRILRLRLASDTRLASTDRQIHHCSVQGPEDSVECAADVNVNADSVVDDDGSTSMSGVF